MPVSKEQDTGAAVKELISADNSVLVTHSLQAMHVSKRFGIKISIKNTEVLIQDTYNKKLNPQEVLLK